MKLIPLFLLVGVLAVSGWAENDRVPYSPELAQRAESGDAKAQYSLSVCYCFGIGVEKDEKEAAKWITKSAEQGDAKAQYSLGVYYLDGFGVEKDEKEAVKWLTKSAEQGNAHAKKVLEENSGRAEAYSAELVKRAQAGDAEAQFLLGNGYYYGSHGLTINYKEAVKWLAKSAAQGYTRARLTLGVCYFDGKGVAKNEKEALKCWTKAAEEGDVDAQLELGLLYENGTGVSKNKKEAVKWYTKAADQGDERAKKALERLKSK